MASGLWVAVGLAFVSFIAGEAEAYQNHTVGGNAGWFFDIKKNASVTDYTKWANTQTFSLGDYLIFNTNANHSVIQTYNATTYNDCSYDDSEDDDTVVWTAVDPTNLNSRIVASVPLTIEGMNYFLSSAMDGIECVQGLKFGMNVSHGQGLPPSLAHPPPPPYVDPSPSPADDTPTTATTVVAPPPPGSGSERISALRATALSSFLLGFNFFYVFCF